MSTSRRKRIIVDTNCWISFLISGTPASLFPLLCKDKVEVILCEELLEEIKEVTLRPKFKRYFPVEEVNSLIAFLRAKCSLFAIGNTEANVCRDPEDNFLLELIQASGADYLLTGDKDLLVLERFRNCQIIDIKTFETLFGARS